MSTQTLMTAEQFAQMSPATGDFELVDGELIPLPSGTPMHGRVRDLTGRRLGNYFEAKPLGEAFAELDCRLGPDVVRRPDLSIFLGERRQQLDLNLSPVPFAPDITVEVLSPSESAMDVNRKVRDYLRAGVKETWVVDHATGEVFVHSLSGIRLLAATDVLETPLLPGFTLRLEELFRS